MSYIGWITLAFFILGIIAVGQFYLLPERGSPDQRMNSAFFAGFGFIFLGIAFLMFFGRLFYMAFFS